jgi:cardiolipin synthase
MKLIIQPADGVAPLLAAIKGAKKTVEIAIFRCDRKDVEMALIAAAARGVRVTALIASTNHGGNKILRQLELRFLEAGVIVARTADDLVRYHGKYMIIDRRVLYVLSFNFTHLDINKSRGFGIVTTRLTWLREAVTLFKADCTRTPHRPKAKAFVVSPLNSRRVLGDFLKRATRQLLIYDPMVSDKAMLQVLRSRAKAGVEIKIIGHVAAQLPFEVQKLASVRLHTRTIIRDQRQAFVGSQSLRSAELDSRREVGLIIHDSKAVKQIADTFESDWIRKSTKPAPVSTDDVEPAPEETSSEDVAKAVKVLKKGLAPLATTVKDAVKQAVVKAGEEVLHNKEVKSTMKKVVKQAVKEAVKDVAQEVQEAQEAIPPKASA